MKILIEESVLRQVLKSFEKMPFQNSEMVSNAASALRASLDAAEKIEPIYQVWQRWDWPSHWDDVDKEEYDHEECAEDKRIIYEYPVSSEEGEKE